MTPVDELLTKLGPRRQSFAMVCDYLRRIPDSLNRVLVETGCIRSQDDYGAGYSTYLWNLLAEELPRLLVASIDNSLANVQFAERLCPHVDLIHADSVAALDQMDPEVIDVLYLDSFDLDVANPHPSSLHHLCELTAAAKSLKPGALVMVDDNYATAGKGAYVAQFMDATKRRLVFDGVQKIWVW